MPHVFGASRLSRPIVPASWASIVDDLKRFAQLCRDADGDASPEIVAAHDKLVEDSARMLEPAAVADVTGRDLDRVFARAVFQLARLRQAAVGDAGDDDFALLDTVGCRSLAAYEADFYRDPSTLPALKARLRQVTSLSDADLWDVEGEVDRDFDDARRKNAVVAALRERYDLRADSPCLDADVARLFADLYPDQPLAAGEVGLLLTPTLLLFALPFDADGTLRTTRDLSDADRDAAADFWRHVNSVSLSVFSHFPAFSGLDLARIDAGLVGAVSRRVGLGEEAARDEIGRMVTVLARDKLEAYAVHDVWGHAAQAALLRFDRVYEQIAAFAAPLNLDDATGGVTLRQLVADGFDADRFGDWAAALAGGRLATVLTAALAEMMADASEYKLVAADPESASANTSLFKAMPTKLDFVLRDLELIYPKATESLDAFVADPESAAERLGLTPEQARSAAEAWRHRRAFAFAAELSHRPAAGRDDVVEVTLLTLSALHFLGLHRAMLRAYEGASRLDPAAAALPLRGYRDLLILSACAFFEADPGRNLWRLDEFASLHLLPLLERFQAGRA